MTHPIFPQIDPTELIRAFSALPATWKDPVPAAAIICGSGWSSVLDELDVLDKLSFEDILGLGAAGVKGHSGEIVLCRIGYQRFWVFKGRRHFYEGDGWTPVAVPVSLCIQAGIERVLLTNSSGGIRSDLTPGTLMLIEDHINFMGDSPLVGATNPLFGPRFPDQSNVYAPEMKASLKSAASFAKINLATGVYVATRGPVYETPAEVRMLRTMGADAVGMSTVPEAMLASAAGLKVGGVSCITNCAAGILDQALSHAEVTDTTAKTMPKMKALLKTWLKSL